ncbi:MAG: HEAT repeat domain-containing protein [Coriobacteriia bacterium]|nr:HEAT repeat domain-containing protein [Coriobacteriia bacterium]MBS5477375.1 HEAT repeat domain-containing protein [Coriobacteriia bacterium]
MDRDQVAGAGSESAAQMTPAQRVEALAALAHEGDPRVRKSVAIALGSLGVPEATAVLCELLEDAVEGVRVLACQALGRVADPAAVPSLLGRVHDESAEVRAGVLFALASIAAHGGISDEARAALFTPMVVMAFDPDDGVRADAAATLGTLHDERAVEPLVLLSEDACAQVRANACASLGLSDAPDALAVLLSRAEDGAESPLVRVAALDGLARHAERGALIADAPEAARAVELACALAEDVEVARPAASDDTSGQDPTAADVRATAVWALGMLPLGALRERTQLALEGALAGGDCWTQRYAIEALARIGDDAARASLRDLDGRRQEGTVSLPAEVATTLDQALTLLG